MKVFGNVQVPGTTAGRRTRYRLAVRLPATSVKMIVSGATKVVPERRQASSRVVSLQVSESRANDFLHTHQNTQLSMSAPVAAAEGLFLAHPQYVRTVRNIDVYVCVVVRSGPSGRYGCIQQNTYVVQRFVLPKIRMQMYYGSTCIYIRYSPSSCLS